MSVITVRHIKVTLEKLFNGRIDTADVAGRKVEEQESTFLSRALAAYAVMQLANCDETAAGGAVTDGFDDNGVDAVHFDSAERVLFVVQSKWIHSGQGSPERGEVQKFIKGVSDLINLQLERFNDKLRAKKQTLTEAFHDPNVKLRLVIAYTGAQPLSSHAEGDLNDLIKELNDPVEVATVTPLSQRELHEAVSGRLEGEPIPLEVLLHDWGQLRHPLQAYYGQVDAESIAAWARHGARLFAKNLRHFQGATDVNEGIQESLITDPEHFWYLNNGITILCSAIKKAPMGGSDTHSGVFHCDGVSVVNGAQTVGCVARAWSTNPLPLSKARVFVRFISLENAPEGLAARVTRAANTQNRIEKRDFVSLDPQQERLRRELAFEGKEYTYKSGDLKPSHDKGCDLEEATVALACAFGDVSLAVQAKREIGRLWDDITKPPYRLLFNTGLSALHMLRCVEVARDVDFALGMLQGSVEGRDYLIAVHGNRFILHKVFQKMQLDRFSDPSFDMKPMLGLARLEAGRVLTKTVAAVNAQYEKSYPANIFKNVSKCRDLEARVT